MSQELVEMDYGHVPDTAKESIFRIVTREKKAMIVAAIRQGASVRMASGMAQVSYNTVKCAIRHCEKELSDCEYHGWELTENALWLLKIRSAEAWFLEDTRVKFASAMDKDPRSGGAYLEFLSRLHRTELGRSQVLKVEQDTTVRVEFVERTGAEWQSGNARSLVRTEALALPPGDESDVVDTETVESDDDNAF